MTPFFAHSFGADKSEWEALHVHLQRVSDLAHEFGARFGAGEIAAFAGLLHDAGKYHPDFLRRLDGEAIRHDHSTAGAKIAVEHYGPTGKLIAPAIAGHHAGLANWLPSEGEKTPVSTRLANAAGISDVRGRMLADGLVLPSVPSGPGLRASGAPGFQRAFLARMIFSCLVDADFLATEAFYAASEGWAVPRGSDLDLSALKARFDVWMENKTAGAPSTPVNRLRNELLGQVRGRVSCEPGLFTLTVPTGGGKTLLSLAFALDHAVRHGLDRIVVVIPYTSIIDQTASVYREALTLAVDDPTLIEHHSAFDPDHAPREREEDRASGRDKLRLSMENWDAPIVLTTAVQFFESLFADRPSRCRKLHRLTNSIIVVDEAQTMPHAFLRPCVAALGELARNYRASVVLSTATQPALRETENPKRSFKGGFRGDSELAPDLGALFAALRRTRLVQSEPLGNGASPRVWDSRTRLSASSIRALMRAHCLSESAACRARGTSPRSCVPPTGRCWAAG
jgi:CRISPR-associated endonuclease/helicase Cas3